MAKYWAGLGVKNPLDENNVAAGVNRSESKILVQQLADASMTLLNGRNFIKTLIRKKEP